jgi:4a-hydroxytetrahydrobiopterin dehydratase
MEKLTVSEIESALAESPEWSEVGGQIQRTYQFDDFLEAMAFVNAVAKAAEAAAHHPDILIRYDKVTLSLVTHDAGGISSKDFDLAKEADGLAEKV